MSEKYTNIDIPPRELLRNFHHNYIEYTGFLIKEYGQTFSYYLKPHNTLVTIDPELIQHILYENKSNYIKGANVPGTAYNRLRTAFGDSIFTTDNMKIWREQHNMAMERLNPELFPEYAEAMVKQAGIALMEWERLCESGEDIELRSKLAQITIMVFTNTIFYDLPLDMQKLIAAIQTYGEDFAASVKTGDELAKAMIAYRKEHPHKDNPDFLDLLINCASKEYKEIEEKYIADSLKALIVAAHETTAAALTWTFWLLSQNPQIEEKLYREIKEYFGDKLPMLGDMDKVPYVLATFYESIRMYPPLYELNRVAVDDDTFKNLHIPKGTYIKIPFYHLHRHKDYWQEPDTFNPERFINNPYGQSNQYAYLPFGLGPRMCVGKNFATMEFFLVLIMIIQKFHVEFPKDYKPVLFPVVTLQPKGGVFVKIKKR